MGSSTAALFGKAILAAPSAMLLTTPARHIIAANAAASQLFGEIANSLNGVAVRKLYAVAEDWADSNAAIAAARPGTIPAPLAVTLIRLPRGMFDAEVTLIPAYDRKNHLVSIIEIIAPVCAPRSLTQQPQHQNASSDAVRLARGAAHDLKNLLAIIKGNVELSQSAVRPNDARVFLREAEDACDMAARLADCMIGFARNRAGTPVAIDVAAAIHHQRAFLQHAVGPAIKITTDATPEAGFILADRTAFENAILNIALNARDAMPDGGNLAISVRTSEIAPAGIACPPAAHGYVEIAIADTGTGMTERVRQRAFDPFFSTKDASGGTGLGLATVLGFARQTGGTATIESRRGAGTTVKIILPKAP